MNELLNKILVLAKSNIHDPDFEELLEIADSLRLIIHERPADQIEEEIETIREDNFDQDGNFLGYPGLEYLLHNAKETE